MKQMLVIIFALIAAILGIATYFGIDWELTVWCVGIGLFIFGKLTMGMYFMQGHGIFPRRSFYGLNIPFLALTGIGALLIACIVTTSFLMPQDDVLLPETIRNFKALSVSMVVGFLAPFVFWVTYLYQATYYGSEYDARMEFKNKGYSDDEIEEKIDFLMGAGAFGKTDGWWPSFLKVK